MDSQRRSFQVTRHFSHETEALGKIRDRRSKEERKVGEVKAEDRKRKNQRGVQGVAVKRKNGEGTGTHQKEEREG